MSVTTKNNDVQISLEIAGKSVLEDGAGDCQALRRFSSMLTKRLKLALVVLAMCMLFTSKLIAQEDTGSISGTVTDSTGALVAKAKVLIRNQATGVAYHLESNGVGIFTSPPLVVGTYAIEVNSPGFKTSSVQNIVLDAAAHFDTNISLNLGESSATIVVQASAPDLNTTDGTVGAVVDSKASQDLPLNGRNVLSLATLTPGVISGVSATADGFNDRGTQVSSIRISGGALGVNNNLLDGTNNLQSYLGEVAINPKSDAISEFRIMSGVIPAQFGYTSGGVINIVTRSGSNKIHGAVYEYFRNDALDAESAFWPKTLHKQELRYNQYGIDVGGPILHDKLFYFANYEQYRFIGQNPTYGQVPTAQERGDQPGAQYADFSDIFPSTDCPTNSQNIAPASGYTKIYDPGNPPISGTRTAFTNNQIPLNRIDPVANAIQKTFYPLPNNRNSLYNSCTQQNNFVTFARSHHSEQQAIGRTDWQLNARNNILARYAYYNNATDNGGGLGDVPSGRNDDVQNYNVALGDTYLFSSSIVNEFRVGGLRSDFPYISANANQNWPQRLGLPGVSQATLPDISNGTPTFSTEVGFRSSTSLNADDDVMFLIHRHTLHLGVDAHMDEVSRSE